MEIRLLAFHLESFPTAFATFVRASSLFQFFASLWSNLNLHPTVTPRIPPPLLTDFPNLEGGCILGHLILCWFSLINILSCQKFSVSKGGVSLREGVSLVLPWDCEAKARAPDLNVDQLIGLNGKDFLLRNLQNLQMTPPLFFRNFLRRGGHL